MARFDTFDSNTAVGLFGIEFSLYIYHVPRMHRLIGIGQAFREGEISSLEGCKNVCLGYSQGTLSTQFSAASCMTNTIISSYMRSIPSWWFDIELYRSKTFLQSHLFLEKVLDAIKHSA